MQKNRKAIKPKITKNKLNFKNTVLNIIKYIKKSPELYKSFFGKNKNRKYKTKDLIECVLFLVKKNIIFRDTPYFFNHNYRNIHWGTIYKFYLKLIHHNIIQNTYYETIKHYLKKSKNKIYLTDTTLILNKMGCESIGYNPQLLKHKTSKISYITTCNGMPIDVSVTAGNHNDSKILYDQINNDASNFHKIITTNNKLLGDAGYDSEKIRIKLNEVNFGILICDRNKRNIKDAIKFKQLELSETDKTLLKKRHKVENIFSHLKQFKRVQTRYDKKINNFYNCVLMASLMIAIKKTSRDNQY